MGVLVARDPQKGGHWKYLEFYSESVLSHKPLCSVVVWGFCSPLHPLLGCAVVSGFSPRGMSSHTLPHCPGRLLPPNAKTALMRSPRTVLKIKGPLRSRARRIAAGIRLGRGAALPAGAAAPGGAGRSGPCQGLTSQAMALCFPKEPAECSFFLWIRKALRLLIYGRLVWALLWSYRGRCWYGFFFLLWRY